MRDAWRQPEFEDDETLVDRSVSFLKELSSRIREQAGRKWRSTNLAVEAGLLRRRRRQWLLMMGQTAFATMQTGRLEADDLQEFYDRIREIDVQIAEKEDRIEELEQDDTLEAAGEDLLLEPALPVPRPRRAVRRRGDRADRAGVETRDDGDEGEDASEPHGIG